MLLASNEERLGVPVKHLVMHGTVPTTNLPAPTRQWGYSGGRLS